MFKAWIAATMLFLAPSVALADLTSKDASMFTACNHANLANIEQSIAVCSKGADWLVERIGKEKGEDQESIRNMAAYCMAIQGYEEIAEGETALGRGHLIIARIGFKAAMQNSINEETVSTAKGGLALIDKALAHK